jgi:pyrroloquinoline-quinone synthase
MKPTTAPFPDPERTLADLDHLIASRSILNHPFYRAWTAGALTRDQLAAYSRSYYPHVAAFPAYLQAAADGSQDPQVRAELLDNLREELAEPRPHAELWLDFAGACGVSAAEVSAAVPVEGARAAVVAFQRLTSGGTAAAVASLYAYESQQPEVSRTKAEGLCRHYGVTDERSLAYFTVHQEADRRHREGERRALARCLAGGASRDEVLAAASEALDAYWGLLDGVCEEAGVPSTA